MLLLAALLASCLSPVEVLAQDRTPRVMEAHRLTPGESIDVDGRLDEAVWEVAPSYADWVQKEPVEGTPAINDTRVWLLYDEAALYVGAVNYDADPTGIARNMARRDAAYAGRSDYFEVMLDPNLDGLTGYRFRVTAGGVQTDRYLSEDSREDAAWDAVYESRVTVDERGWIVEMRIPFSQIRYETSDSAQTWGIQFGRRRAADNELTRFSFVSRLHPGRVSQFGRVRGLEISRSSRRLEVLPYVSSRAHRGPAVTGDPFFDGSEVDGLAGVDVSYGLGSAFTLDATVNPDFGQVEADPAVVNLTAFETFFQERRPFFVEDARIFDYRLSSEASSLFYSRRVGRAPHGGGVAGADFADVPEATSILAATKLTGRTTGGLSVGAMLASTREERAEGFFTQTGEFDEVVVEPRSTYGVVRAQQDFRQGQSRVGGILTTTRRASSSDAGYRPLPSSAYSAGIDFEHTWSGRAWGLSGYFAGSLIRGDSTAVLAVQRSSNHYLQRPDLAWSELDSTATSMAGVDWRLQFDRRVGRWTGAVWAAEGTSGFEVNDLGFSTSQERVEGGFRVSYGEVRPNRLFRTSRVNLVTLQRLSHELFTAAVDGWAAARTAGTVVLSSNVEFLNFWTANTVLSYGPDLMSRTATRGGPRMRDPGGFGVTLGFGTDNRRLLSLRPSVSLQRGREGSGDRSSWRMGVTLQPSTQLLVTLTPAFTRSSDGAQYVLRTATPEYTPTYGSRYLFGELERTDLSLEARVNWTFTPRLSLEVWAQPFVSAGEYAAYKQLASPETFDFDVFEDGTTLGSTCQGGRTCVDAAGVRRIDLQGDGVVDLTFPDRDFNVRSLRSTAVLRWEYRPGSTLFFVWQHRQADRVGRGDFDLGRDLGSMFGAPSDDVLIVKANVWLSW